MRPIVYITAAILAILAGYLAVYVNFQSHSNGQSSGKEQATSKKSSSDTKKADDGEQDKAKSENIITINAMRGLNVGEMRTFVVHQKSKSVRAFVFQDDKGVDKTLADWSGKVVLLNLWATWCAPCRKEMPAFDKLKDALGGDKFDVVTISIDRGGIAKPQKFFNDIGIKNLVLYHDKTSRLNASLNAVGMPTTLLIDRNGKEIGRLVGPAEWDSEDAMKLLKAAIDAK